MKSFLRRQIDRLLRPAAGRTIADPPAISPRERLAGHDGYDVLEVAKLKAAWDSAAYYERNMLRAAALGSDLALLSHAAALAPQDGLLLEFGVASGRTIRHLAAALAPRTVFGFDSFAGLPQDWRTGYPAGHFAQAPPVLPASVELVEGLFAQSLPAFLCAHDGRVAFLHLDCDLYASTATVFDLLGERIVAGTVIVFDEYWNYPGWRQHEFRAFQEFVSARRLTYHYVAFVPAHQQVCVVVQ